MSGEKDNGKLAIKNIINNYKKMEEDIVNQLRFEVSHGTTIGRYREQIWSEMFRNIIPSKFAIEQSVFIIDSNGNVSNEVDLAIFDEMYTPYVFRYGSLKFIPIEAVAVVVECKSSSMKKTDLEEWVKNIKQLKTSRKSFVRMYDKIADGEKGNENKMAQTATRPLRILCCMNKNLQGEQDLDIFDVVIRDDGSGEEKRLNITWNPQIRNLYDWYRELNRAQDTEEDKIEIGGVEKIRNIKLSDYKIPDVSLMTFNFQLNQILMMINNPMLFPHIAYAEMFAKGTNVEGKKNERDDCSNIRR